METNFKNDTCGVEIMKSEDPLDMPIMEIRRNPHTNKYAVFYKVGASGKWKELYKAEYCGCFAGGGTVYTKLRTKIKWLANYRMNSNLLDFFKRHTEFRTQNKFI
jgi:hypothetical protein